MPSDPLSADPAVLPLLWPWLALLLGGGLVAMVLRLHRQGQELADLAELHETLALEHAATGARLMEREAREGELVAELARVAAQWELARAEGSGLRAERAALGSRIKSLEPLLAERSRFLEKLEQSRTLFARLSAENARLTARLEEIPVLGGERDEARRALDELRGQYGELERRYATDTTRSAEEQRALSDKVALLEQAEGRLGREFEHLAHRIFEEKQQRFSEASRSGMEALLNPMREQLRDFRQRVEEVYDKEARDRTSLYHEIGQLKALNQRMSHDALNLTRALKGESKVRGNWGEVQLERILEESGLTRGREYEVQSSHTNEAGQRLRPDVVVQLPQGKAVVIDSKVSLVAYEQYYAAEEEAEREAAIAAHIHSLRTHIRELASKEYDRLIGSSALDLVILFVPIEPALLLALEHAGSLYNEAFQQGILLVSPTTLMGTLQVIHNIWRYEYQNRNAMEIALEAGKLHDQFVLFAEALTEVGRQLGKAQEAWEVAQRRLTDGRGNLVARTRKLQTLGARTKRSLATELVAAAEPEGGE